jgi:hypothetical protein
MIAGKRENAKAIQRTKTANVWIPIESGGESEKVRKDKGV